MTASRGRRPSTPSTRRPIVATAVRTSHTVRVRVVCRESGWPDVAGGSFVESNVAPEWLRRYLVAKRAVEAKLTENSDKLRPVVYRPSLIWSWGKLDVLAHHPGVQPGFCLRRALRGPHDSRRDFSRRYRRGHRGRRGGRPAVFCHGRARGGGSCVTALWSYVQPSGRRRRRIGAGVGLAARRATGLAARHWHASRRRERTRTARGEEGGGTPSTRNHASR